MRFAALFILMMVYCACTFRSAAQTKTEKELVQEIITILQTNDDSGYVKLFPNMALMYEALGSAQPKDSFQLARLAKIQENAGELSRFDPEHNPKILDMMHFVKKKGTDSGLHWNDLAIAKFELDKQWLPKELYGFELIAPLRMQGYIFVRDMLTRRRYAIAVRDIFLINDKWYGGLTLNILEASSAAEYEEELAMEERELQKLMLAKKEGRLDKVLAQRDSIRKTRQLAMDEDEDEDLADPALKEIVERKLFTGYFDKQVEVELYVRYIKGACPQTVCSWEAMYKFGDMKDYVKLEVERKPDGTFVFTEQDLGVMELKMGGDTFTGVWISSKDKTEYETYLKEKQEVKDRRLVKLDQSYEQLGLSK